MWEVLDPNGVMHPSKGRDGGSPVRLPQGAKVQQRDIEVGNFTEANIEALIANGRIKSLEPASNKKMPKASNKGTK